MSKKGAKCPEKWEKKTVYMVLTFRPELVENLSNDDVMAIIRGISRRFGQYGERHNWTGRMVWYPSYRDGHTGESNVNLHIHGKLTCDPGQTGIDLFRDWWEKQYGIAKVKCADEIHDEAGLLRYWEKQSFGRVKKTFKPMSKKHASSPKSRQHKPLFTHANHLDQATTGAQAGMDTTWFFSIDNSNDYQEEDTINSIDCPGVSPAPADIPVTYDEMPATPEFIDHSISDSAETSADDIFDQVDDEAERPLWPAQPDNSGEEVLFSLEYLVEQEIEKAQQPMKSTRVKLSRRFSLQPPPVGVKRYRWEDLFFLPLPRLAKTRRVMTRRIIVQRLLQKDIKRFQRRKIRPCGIGLGRSVFFVTGVRPRSKPGQDVGGQYLNHTPTKPG